MSLDTAKAVVTLRDLTVKFDNTIRSASPFYPNLCTTVNSQGADEKYGLLGNVPGVREWVGDRVFNDMRAGTFTIENKHWEQSLLIKKTDIADDRMALYGPLMQQLGVEAAYHPDELLFENLIVNGESVACFDGQYFFDTDHSWGDSGTQDNDLTYNASDHTAVTAAEFRAAFHAALVKLVGYKNDRGKLLNRPTGSGLSNIMVVVPPTLWEAAVVGLTAPMLSNNSNIVLEQPTIRMSAHLTSGVKFYVFNLGAPLKPFVFQAREALSRGMNGLNDIETKDVKFMTEARYNLGYLAWWTAVLTTFN